ncbi:hypothetical protein GOQ27_10565 [Clostridium sp. D2Q-11]|uniref:DUF5673 domain-containing protein n=1 Tax=Anaeromonas frigoriresistens TaxID=2683708 RepID=A0A942Z9I8_9FIRM|nr:hypothetical protein [Anaeromonas frigoriresistens]MBS4538910.1 hypothetical protein [Anaeromonas frigoriresistens]
MWDVILGILFLLIFIIIIREEYIRRKYEVVVKSIKEIHYNAYFSVMWFLIAVMYLPTDSIREFNNNELREITDSIPFFTVAILHLISGLRRNLINEYGIITHNAQVKWKKVLNYEWNDKIKKKRNKEYYILKLLIRTNKFDKKVFGSDERKIFFKIPIEDREKVEEYLNRKLNTWEI